MNVRSRFEIVGAVALAAACTTANAQVSDGDFSGQVSNWTTNGNVQFVAVGIHSNGVALFQEPGEGTKPGAGSRARTYQNVDMTGEPSIVFRYQLSVGAGTRDPAVPPDSFTATLFNTTAGRRVIPKQATDVPDFSNGFYYADADGAEVYDPSIVTVSGPDGDGAKVITLSVSTTGTARVEFGFASAANGVTSR